MNREFSQHFEDIFVNYKKTYQKFMGYTDAEMPTDECLLIVALNGDADTMLKDMQK